MDTITAFNFLIFFSSTILGIFVGLIPGIGILVSVLLCYPILLTFDLFQCLLFYLAVYSASQFSGSIVATTLGIPGESSSLPAVKEGFALYNKGKGSLAISGAALGSVFGAMVACLLTVILMPYALYLIKNFYNNTLQVFILLSVSVLIICINKQIITNILLFVFGLLLASIGFKEVPPGLNYKNIIPYDSIPDLIGGLPTFPVLVALFVVPILAKHWHIKSQKNTADINKKLKVLPFIDHLKNYTKHFSSGVRGSILGIVAGLVPHLTSILASNLSYIVEKYIGTKRKTYSNTGDMATLISSETSNNSAAFTSLLPLVMLGIPISASEAVLLSIIESTSNYVNYKSVIISGIFNELLIWFVAINVFAFILAWPMVKYVNLLYRMPIRLTFGLILLVLFVLIGYIGSESYQSEYHYMVFLILAPIGYMLRNTDTIVLIVGFILHDKIYEALNRAIIIWSV